MITVDEELGKLPAGSRVAVVTLLGSFCPVTEGHVQMFTEARKLLLMINDVSPRGHFFEPFAACVGFISLNSDRYLEEKLAPSGDRLLTKQQRLALIEMATAKIPWLQSCAEHHKESVQDLRHKWPALHFEHFEMNGADDVVKYQKWQYTLPLSENPSTIHHHGTPRKHTRFEGGNDARWGGRKRCLPAWSCTP